VKYLKEINQKNSNANAQQRSLQLNIPNAENKNAKDSLQKRNWAKEILDVSLRVMMMVRNVSFTYTEGNGTLLPGFNQVTGPMGINWNNGAPGWDFVFGAQVNIAERAAENHWITQSQMLNNPMLRKHNQNLNGRISVEPFSQLKIEITFLRNFSYQRSEYWRYDTLAQQYGSYTPTETGSYSISYNLWRTSFVQDDDITHSSKTFENFKEFLLPIAQRLASQNPYYDGTYTTDTLNGVAYPTGYSRTSSQVMMYSFLAAYSGQEPGKVELTPFPKIPRPNWRLTFDGLTKIEIIDQWFKSVSISHSYTSTYTMGGFSTNMRFKEGQDGYTWVIEQLGSNFVPKYDANMISINEQYSPLINFDMTLENSLILKFAVRKSRNLSMSFSNNQITEIKQEELSIGTGYRLKQVPLSLKLGGGQKTFKSDINLRLDFSIRNNKTLLRKLIEDVDQISQGTLVYTINFSADYQFSKSITFRAFYDQVLNRPHVSNQYKSSNTKGGISILFSLAQ